MNAVVGQWHLVEALRHVCHTENLGLERSNAMQHFFHVWYLLTFVGDHIVQRAVVYGEPPTSTRLSYLVYLGPRCVLGWPYDIPVQELINKGAQCRLLLDAYLSRSQPMRASLP